MIVYFADRKFNILGLASTNLPSGLVISSDTKAGDVESGISVFECKIAFDNATRAKVEECTEVGNFILRKNDDEEDELYTIIDAEIDIKKQTVYIYAEDAGLDLLNEIVGEYEADKEYGIDHYVEMVTKDSGFVIGLNEASGMKRQLTFDKEQNVTARLASIAAAFDSCEVSYSFEIKGLRCVGKTINIYKKRGKDIGVTLHLNKEIDNIVITKTIANMATALRAEGATPEGADDPITLSGYEYDDGDFYVAGDTLKSRKALQKWSRYINPDEPNLPATKDGHIVRLFSYDTTEQAVLCAETIRELQKICDKEVNYEADILSLPRNVKVGDRVNIVDEKGKLFLSTRLLKLERSIVDDEHKAVLGEHLLKKSGISQKVIELAEQHAKNAEAVEKFVKVSTEAVGVALDARLQAEDAKEKADSAYDKSNEAYDKSNEAYAQASKAVVKPSISGQYSRAVVVENAIADSIDSITIYGKTTQNGTPAPTAPVAMESAGNSGSISVTVTAQDFEQRAIVAAPNGLPGIPIYHPINNTAATYTDANGQRWISDEIDLARGVYVQRLFSVVLDGTENWASNSTQTAFLLGSLNYSPLLQFAFDANYADAFQMCSHFKAAVYGSTADNEVTSLGSSRGNTLVFRCAAYSDLDSWKAYLAAQAAAGTPVTLLLCSRTIVETPLKGIPTIPGNPAGDITVTSEGNLFVELSEIASGTSVRNAQTAADEALVTANDAKYYADEATNRVQELAEMIPEWETQATPTVVKDWSYIKWADGRAELWGRKTFSSVNCTNATGAFFRSDTLVPFDAFPFTIMRPYVVASVECDGSTAFLCNETQTSSTQLASYFLVSPISATVRSVNISVYVVGQWQLFIDGEDYGSGGSTTT